MSGRILVSCIHLQRCFEEYRADFDQRGYDVELPRVDQQLEESWLVENIARFDGVIAGDDPFPRQVLEAGAAGRLRVLVKWGIGVDAIDREAAEELGLDFAHTPGVFGDEVADVAMGYVVMLARRLHEIDRSVREGGWLKPVGTSLRGKTLGVVGLGSIGRAIAQRGLAFGMEVIGCDAVAVPSEGSMWVQLNQGEVLRGAHFLVLACDLTPENHHLLDEETLALLPEGAFVINVARGPLIDEEALLMGLRGGRIAGAALDVFEVEPLAMDSILRECDNCIFGSHNGSNTREAVDRVNRISVDKLFELLDGLPA